MENNFVTIGTFHYNQAYFIRKQLQIKGVFSFTDSGIVPDGLIGFVQSGAGEGCAGAILFEIEEEEFFVVCSAAVCPADIAVRFSRFIR